MQPASGLDHGPGMYGIYISHMDKNNGNSDLVCENIRIHHECEGGINRIHHWCSVGTEKSHPEGPPFQWETRLAEFPTERWTRGLGSCSGNH